MGYYSGNQTAFLALKLQNSNQILILNFFNLSTNSYPVNLEVQASDVLIMGNFLFTVLPSINQISIFLLSKTTSFLLNKITAQLANKWNPNGNNDWTPINIYYSSSNCIIVESNTGFYVLGIDFNNIQLNFLSFTSLYGGLSQTNYFRSIKVWEDSIVINEDTLTQKSNIQTLTEYNFINPHNITFTHEV